MITYLTDSNVDAMMKNNRATYILFYEPQIPTLEDIKAVFAGFDKQLNGKVDIMFCDIGSQKYVSEYFQMNVLPAVLFLKNGNVYGNLAGPASASKYQDILKDALGQLIAEQKG